ncbi:MAG: site-2 protease family protein [Nanoarchaeota archaeon]|nr:site-2 protease family protein [Nanoarchaeota archaeon]
MSFFIYDLIFLVAFVTAFSSFLYTHRKNLKREGLLYLYKADWGIKLIKKIGTKYKKTMKVTSYASIVSGYFLMAGMLYLLYTIVKIYFFSPSIVRAVKIPPIMPLVPYLPQVFKLDFLPPFYFSYWIIIIAVVAIVHEMAHGIIAAYNKVDIKTTGFGFFPFFLPIFLAAFVEPDEKQMKKKSTFAQMAVLGAGTFANVLTSIFFLIIFLGFSFLAFAPSGVMFDGYATSAISVAGISSVNGISVGNLSYYGLKNLLNDEGLNEIDVGDEKYLVTELTIESQEGRDTILVYNSAPAIKNNISSIITKIGNVEIKSFEGLIEQIELYSLGDEILLTTLSDEGEIEQMIILEEHPDRPDSAWLGIGFSLEGNGRLLGNAMQGLSFREPHVYYEPRFDGMSIFIYNLLWWMVLISISVAFVNMLPVGIFDGGRFFYLTVLSLTKSEKIAEKAFKLSTRIFLVLLFAIIIFWGISFFR